MEYILSLCFVVWISLLPVVKTVGMENILDIHSIDNNTRADSDDWCYHDTKCDQSSDKWKSGVCKDGKKQSPIDLKTARVSIDYEYGCPIDFGLTKNNAYDLAVYKIENTGKTIQISEATPGDFSQAKFRWPNKNDGEYTLHSIHFHWGPDDNSGSEHTIDSKAFPMEAHFVHYRSSQYKNITEATKSNTKDALAVIGLVVDVWNDKPRPDTSSSFFLKDVVKALEKVPASTDANVGAALEAVVVNDVPITYHGYIKSLYSVYHYEGSLTTPECNEIVQWIVYRSPVPTTSSDIQKLRDLTKQQSTFRVVQDIKDRKLEKVVINNSDSRGPPFR